MNVAKALYHVADLANQIGWSRAFHVIRFKKSRKGGVCTLDIPTLGGNVFLRRGTADTATIDQFTIRDYIPTQLSPTPRTIVDLGANIGLATRYFKRAFPEAIVVAIEPDQENYNLLQKNLAGLQGCHSLLAAIWPTGGSVAIERDGLRHSSFRTRAMENATGEVRAITVEDILERYALQRIDLLKIDIEGAELELFSAGDLTWLDRVDCIAIELHDHFRPGCGNAFFNAMTKGTWTYRIFGEMIFCERSQHE